MRPWVREVLAPLADGRAAGDPLGDRPVVQAVGAQQHDLGAAHQPGRLRDLAGSVLSAYSDDMI